VNTLYVIAAMTNLNCGVDVLCLRSVEPDSTGESRTRLLAAQHDATHQLDLRCVPQGSALPYLKR
jgi:hypothetical protein